MQPTEVEQPIEVEQPKPEPKPEPKKEEPKKEEPKKEEPKPEPKPVYTSEVIKTYKNIDFKTVRKETSDLFKGEEKVSQKGVVGSEEKQTKVYYKDGKEYKREVIKTSTIKKPVNKIVLVGTKQKVAEKPVEKKYYAYEFEPARFFFFDTNEDISEDQAVAWAENIRFTKVHPDGTINEDNYMIKNGFVGYAGGSFTYKGLDGIEISFYK